jgi:hypothetical protein
VRPLPSKMRQIIAAVKAKVRARSIAKERPGHSFRKEEVGRYFYLSLGRCSLEMKGLKP